MFVPIDRDAIAGGVPEIGVLAGGAVTGLPKGQQIQSAGGGSGLLDWPM